MSHHFLEVNILEEEILSENTIINKKVVSSIMKAEYKKKKEQKSILNPFALFIKLKLRYNYQIGNFSPPII